MIFAGVLVQCDVCNTSDCVSVLNEIRNLDIYIKYIKSNNTEGALWTSSKVLHLLN